jgi:DNA-binding NarL/FixJ family response regulator
MTVRVVLADDQTLIRAGISSLLDAAEDLEVVGEASNGVEAVELARGTRPDVVVMDIRMPELDGLEATRQIVADDALAEVRVLVLTTFEVDEYVLRALRAGASGFLGKGVGPRELADAIRLVARGDALLSPAATRGLITRFLARPHRMDGAVPELLQVLTEREREIVAQVAMGMSNEEIAERLFLAESTVKTHLKRSMAKLGARDRAQIVVIAYQTGLVTASG